MLHALGQYRGSSDGDDDQPSTDETGFWKKNKTKNNPDILAINTHKTLHDSRAVQACVLPLVSAPSIFTAWFFSLHRFLSLATWVTYTCHEWVQLARKRNLCSQSVNATTILIWEASKTLPSAISSCLHHHIYWETPPDGHFHHPASEDLAAGPHMHSCVSHSRCTAPDAFAAGATSSLQPRETRYTQQCSYTCDTQTEEELMVLSQPARPWSCAHALLCPVSSLTSPITLQRPAAASCFCLSCQVHEQATQRRNRVWGSCVWRSEEDG